MPDRQSFLARPTEAPGTAGEDARIEQLLVSGLDHYFVGEFDAAIHLWTRVLFLNRTHDRARAYIDRARSAQAEYQRQTEALVHQGLDAFDRGRVDQARSLLRDAIDRGAPPDMALGVMGRIDRLDVGPGLTPAPPVRTPRLAAQSVIPAAPSRYQTSRLYWSVVSLLVALAASLGWWAWTAQGPSFGVFATTPAATEVVATALITPLLPSPTATEAYLVRGQALFASGRVYDALDQLAQVPVGDAARPDADRLRGQIQRELLAVAMAEASAAPVSQLVRVPQ